MSLSTILKEIETNRPNAEMDIQMSSPETYRGRVGLKNAATEALKRLKTQYKNELMKSTLFIVVTGAAREQLTSLASSDTFQCFSADPEALYKELVSQVTPSLFGRESPKNLFNVVTRHLRDKAKSLDIKSLPMLLFNDKYNKGVKVAEDLVPLVKAAINDQVGSEIVGINAMHSIVDTAVNKGHTAQVTPLILSTADEAFALDLSRNLKTHRLPDGVGRGLTPNVFLVVAGKASKELTKTPGAIVLKTVNETTVGEALVTIRTKVL